MRFIFASIVFFFLVYSNPVLQASAALEEANSDFAVLIASPLEFLKKMDITLHALALNKGSSFLAGFIMARTGGDWSHDGMIFADRHDRHNREKWWCLDVLYETELIPWETCCYNQDETAVATALRIMQYDGVNEPDSSFWINHIEAYLGRPNALIKRPLTVVLACFNLNFIEDDRSVLCSELIAILLQEAKLLKTDRLARNIDKTESK